MLSDSSKTPSLRTFLTIIASLLAGLVVCPTNSATSAAGAVQSQIGAPLDAEAAHTTLSPYGDEGSIDQWRADFTLAKPSERLVLNRSSTGERSTPWRLVDDGFEFAFVDNREVIRRKNGKTFTNVSVIIPMAINADQKGTLPFTRFGDGGFLFDSAFLRACGETCPKTTDGDDAQWRMTINTSPDHTMVLRGQVVQGALSFVDKGDGATIYIGDGAIVDHRRYISVTDKTLPGDLSAKLDALAPRLLAYFSTRLGRLKEKPTLFVSFTPTSVTHGPIVSASTLQNQVFLGIEGNNPDISNADNELSFSLAWFVTREMATLYQKRTAIAFDEAENWIHEGAADAFAYLALKDLNAAPASFLANRLATAKAQCAEALHTGSLKSGRDQTSSRGIGDCGLIAHLAADAASQTASGDDLFALWKTFLYRVRDGASWNGETYAQVVRESAGRDPADFIERLIAGALKNPENVIENGLQSSGFEAPTP